MMVLEYFIGVGSRLRTRFSKYFFLPNSHLPFQQNINPIENHSKTETHDRSTNEQYFLTVDFKFTLSHIQILID